jgi:hypothetical protein
VTYCESSEGDPHLRGPGDTYAGPGGLEMKRILITSMAAIVAVAAALLVGRAVPRVGAAQAATTSDVTFTEGTCNQATAHCKNIYSHDPTAFGARIIFSIPLSSGGNRIGREKGECVFLNRRSHKYFCTYNIGLAAGSVSVQGTLPYDLGSGATIPITGGTGGYEGAYGYLKLIKSSAPPVRYRLHIITP